MHKYVYLWRLLLCASVFLAAGLALSGQSSTAAAIHGTVRDPQTASVGGATVTVFANNAGMTASTTTDASGAFHADGLSAGDYVVEVRAPGFARYSSQSVHLGRGETRAVDISLQIEAAQQQVTVTASGTAATPDETAKSVSVLDHQEIEERDEASLATALGTLPGLRVQQLGGPGGLTSIKIRGLRSEDTGILFDGLRFRDITTPQGDASSFIQDFVDTDIDRIEVLRGAGSSLYGTNAIGGVVNLIGDQGGGQAHGSVLLEGGELGSFRGKAQIGGGALDNRLQYSAGITHWNVTAGVGGNTPARITSGQGHVSYQLTPTVQLVARMYAADSFSLQVGEPEAVGGLPPLGIVDAIAPPASVFRQYERGVPLSQLNLGNATFFPAPDDPDSSRAARFIAGAFILNGHPSSIANYSFTYQGESTRSNFGNGPAGVGYQPFGGNTHSINSGMDQIVNAQGSLQWTPHSLLNGGYEFELENYTGLSLQPANAGNSQADASQRSNAVFAQDQERYFGNRLILAGSFRVQFFHLDQPTFTPSRSAPYAGITVSSPPNAYTGDGSAAWFFRSTGTKIRAHGSRGYRAPSIYERFGTYFDPIYGYSIYGDPRLTPEHTTSFDAGAD
ncbi:MAG: TonB-dependent receptor, partial [Bryobacteraceae bacterium]